MENGNRIEAQLKVVPTKPGCYLMKDKSGKVIYVGKAINLRNRVRSYFHNSAQNHPRTQQLVRKISDIDWIVVDSELEALILEMNLIKRYRPHYNIRLKDDKQYPYIKVHWSDPFPKVTVTRRMVQDGSRYFGPYTSVWAVHQTLDLIRRIFPYLTCDRTITGGDERACLYYDIKLCIAPCIGAVDQDEYRAMTEDLCQFLLGRTEPIVSRMKAQMNKAAQELQFEKAATVRDQLRAIENIVERQKVISSEYVDSDVIAMARSDGEACVQVFFIRGGKLIGREYFLLEGTAESPDPNVIAEFIKQFYDQSPMVPPQVLLPHELEEAQIIQQWLRKKSNAGQVELLIPEEGQLKDLVNMAAENAAETLTALQAQWQSDRHRQTEALAELQAALEITEPLSRIECYDISNTQGTAAVGSMVVYEQGVPKKQHYRRFNIRNVSGPDDFASMEEVLRRRFKRWSVIQEAEDAPGNKPDPSFALLPELILVDGGKGQLGRAIKVVEQYGLTDQIHIAGLAKQNEELFVRGKSKPIILPRQSQGLYLVQRIRDEAHRFAITSHRNRRTKLGLASRLDVIPGIGPTRRKKLLQHFGSLKGIEQASIEELEAVPGINRKLAEAIKSDLG